MTVDHLQRAGTLLGAGSMTLYGYKVVLNDILTESVKVVVERDWKERLFTRPWKPFKKTKIVIQQKPSNNVIKLGQDTLIMHPEMWKSIVERMRNVI